MAVLRRDVTAQPGAKWNLVYDQGRHELYVEIHSNGAIKRHVVDLFKAIPRDTDDGHVQTN
jgi:hypothetical protein